MAVAGTAVTHPHPREEGPRAPALHRRAPTRERPTTPRTEAPTSLPARRVVRGAPAGHSRGYGRADTPTPAPSWPPPHHGGTRVPAPDSHGPPRPQPAGRPEPGQPHQPARRTAADPAPPPPTPTSQATSTTRPPPHPHPHPLVRPHQPTPPHQPPLPEQPTQPGPTGPAGVNRLHHHSRPRRPSQPKQTKQTSRPKRSDRSRQASRPQREAVRAESMHHETPGGRNRNMAGDGRKKCGTNGTPSTDQQGQEPWSARAAKPVK